MVRSMFSTPNGYPIAEFAAISQGSIMMKTESDQHAESSFAFSNRRTLLRRSLALGVAAPAILSAVPAALLASQNQATPAADAQPFQRYDPFLGPAKPHRKKFAIDVQQTTVEIAPGATYTSWTYDGTIPGRTFRVVEGDRVDITLRVDPAANTDHSIEVQAARTPPDVDFKPIAPGEKFTWNFRADRPGAYLYHCAAQENRMYHDAGMYGAFIVDPKEGWSPAQELILVQGDFPSNDGPNGMMMGRDMDRVMVNGHATQYVDEPIQVKVGEPIRIFVVNAGPHARSSFRVVGAIFDSVYANASPKNQLFDLPSVALEPGESACVEFVLDEPGTYPIVNQSRGGHNTMALLEAN